MSAEVLTTPQLILYSKGTGCLQVKSCLGLQTNSKMVFVDQVKSREPDKRFRVLHTHDRARSGKSGCLSHLCLKRREHAYRTFRVNPMNSRVEILLIQTSLKNVWISRQRQHQGQAHVGTSFKARHCMLSGVLLLDMFLCCSNGSSVPYSYTLLSDCCANVNVCKYSRQIPILKHETCHILAFIMASSRVMASSRI